MTLGLHENLAAALLALDADYAWTRNEIAGVICDADLTYCDDNELLHHQPTQIGTLIMLTSRARKLLTGYSHDPISLTRRVDKAYLRLCLAELDFQPVLEGDGEDHTRLSPNRGFIQCRTPDSLALVTGHLSGGGMTRQSIQDLARSLQSNALFNRFRIIVITPHPRRGQKMALKHQQVLSLITHLPNQSDDPDEVGEMRLTILDSERERYAESASITASQAERRAALGVPDLTLEILQLNRAERIDRARADLEIDQVMTVSQLERHYDLEAADFNGTLSVRELVRPVHTRMRDIRNVTFLLASSRLANLSAPTLGHKAGTTELRHQLGAVADEDTWRVEKRGRHAGELPDATWVTPHGLVGVEYDSGAYSPTMISFKIQNFRALEITDIQWGTTNVLRCQRLARRHNINVRLTEWWK
jgi:hypothetical protein